MVLLVLASNAAGRRPAKRGFDESGINGRVLDSP